jgi:hypothetical protein
VPQQLREIVGRIDAVEFAGVDVRRQLSFPAALTHQFCYPAQTVAS